MRTFGAAHTYQNMMVTILSDNTKSDEMKILVNCSAGWMAVTIETMTGGCA